MARPAGQTPGTVPPPITGTSESGKATADAAAAQIRQQNADSAYQTAVLNAANKEGDREKELAAAKGNSQKAHHDAMMALIGNLK